MFVFHVICVIFRRCMFPSVSVLTVSLRFVRLDFVYDLFEHVLSRNKQDTLKSSSKHRRPTVSSQFKVSPRPTAGSLQSPPQTLSVVVRAEHQDGLQERRRAR